MGESNTAEACAVEVRNARVDAVHLIDGIVETQTCSVTITAMAAGLLRCSHPTPACGPIVWELVAVRLGGRLFRAGRE